MHIPVTDPIFHLDYPSFGSDKINLYGILYCSMTRSKSLINSYNEELDYHAQRTDDVDRPFLKRTERKMDLIGLMITMKSKELKTAQTE